MTVRAASFRDPAGSCGIVNGRVFRVLEGSSVGICTQFLESPCAKKLLANGTLVRSWKVPAAEADSLLAAPEFQAVFGVRKGTQLLEHESIPFTSYPYEWAPKMLWSAAELTLATAREALRGGYELKDATPYNVLFRGPNPVFVDLGSFECGQPGNALWEAYAQFVRTFLLPLLASRRWHLKLADVFLTHRDGLEPEEVYGLCGLLERFHPRILPLVSLPTWLRGKALREGEKLYEHKLLSDPEKALFLLESLFNRLGRALAALTPAKRDSLWSDYMQSHSYSEPSFAAKEQFVSRWLDQAKPKQVLDAGANTGHFSALAARAGASVVALDLDENCVDGIWHRARAKKLDILPLTGNLARPTPAMGWRNRECPSFLERAAGRFDCVLMLALIHHLQVTERAPLSEVLRLAADLTTDLAIIEYVGPEDKMFRELLRGRGALHADLSEQQFESACLMWFTILDSWAMAGTQRKLYALKRKPTA